MESFKNLNSILYVWENEDPNLLKKCVEELKNETSGTVVVENVDRLHLAEYANSSFCLILLASKKASTENCKKIMNLLKSEGKLFIPIAKIESKEQIEESLRLAGFVNIECGSDGLSCKKPKYDTGSSIKLSFARNTIASVWKIDADEEDDDTIDENDLLGAADAIKPEPDTLTVCGTTGKRKACKNCSCGLAAELEAGKTQATPIETQNANSSCGSCYLGDAFRCSTCPYLGMPAFKPGEKVQLTDDQMKSDL